MPLEPLLRALYFAAPWNKLKEVTAEQFVADFNFEDRRQVEYLFGSEIDEEHIRREVKRVEREIEEAVTKPFSLKGPSLTTQTTSERVVRDKAFTEAVRRAYKYSCAVCRLQLDSPAGRWEVQAAHIFPKRYDGSDDIRNGIALCHNHHWAFDEHLFTIDDKYRVVWNERVKKTNRVGGDLHLPKDRAEWPNQEQALSWHRTETFQLWTMKTRTKRK